METDVGVLFVNLKRALGSSTGFESVDSTVSANSIRLLGRVPPTAMPAWKSFVEVLLAHENAAPWSVDVSKKYFLKSGALVFGWRLQFKCDSSATVIQHLLELLRESDSVTPSPSMEELEVPLLGARADRPNVGLLGKVAVGAGARRS